MSLSALHCLNFSINAGEKLENLALAPVAGCSLEFNEDLQTPPQAMQGVSVTRTTLAGKSFEQHVACALQILMYFNLHLKDVNINANII
jgi:hypothetical protein